MVGSSLTLHSPQKIKPLACTLHPQPIELRFHLVLHPRAQHLPEIRLYFQMNLHPLKLPDNTFLLLPSGAPILGRRKLHHLQLRVRQVTLAEATVRRGMPARAQAGQEATRRPSCATRHLVLVRSERYGAQRPQKRISWDVTVLQPVRPEGHLAVLLRRLGILGEPMVHQGGGALAEGSSFQEPRLRGRGRARFLDGTTDSAPGGALGRVTASFGNPRGTDGPSRGGALAEGSAFEEPHLRGHDGTTASAPGGALGRVTASFGNPRGTDGPSRGGGSRRKICF